MMPNNSLSLTLPQLCGCVRLSLDNRTWGSCWHIHHTVVSLLEIMSHPEKQDIIVKVPLAMSLPKKHHLCICICIYGLPWWHSGKESAWNAGAAGDLSSIPGWGRSPGGRHGNPLQYACVENPMDRRAWWAAVRGITESQTQLKWISTYVCVCVCVYITCI